MYNVCPFQEQNTSLMQLIDVCTSCIKVIFIVNSVETMTKVVFKKTIVIYFLFSHHYLKLVKKQKT